MTETLDTAKAKAHIADWRDRLGDQTLVSSTEVQTRLFDLWAEFGGEKQETVQHWLTLTLERQLFGRAELLELLGQLEPTPA